MADTPPLPRREAEAIRTRRLELGWTQHRLAHESGISVATVRKLEGHKQPYYRALTLVPLCRALGWPSNALNTMLPPGANADDDATGQPDAPQPADFVSVDDPGSELDAIAAFDGDVAGLNPDELAELAAFVRQLRSRRQS